MEKRLVTFLIAAFSMGQAVAQITDSLVLNKIVVTASRKEFSAFETPDAVSVLSGQELKNNAPRSLADALTGTTGVWMQKTNHGGGSPIVRGLTGNQTLLLIDGIRLNNATFRYGPNQYFNTIDVFSVDRVEVVRGKGSVLYGSDALGGVINVLTSSPEYISGKPRLGGRGQFKYMNRDMEKSGAGELSFQAQNFALSGNVNYKDFGDLFAGGSLGYERPSGYQETGVNLKGRLRLAGNWQLTSAYQYLIQNDVPRYDQVAQRGYSLYSYDPQVHRLSYIKLEHFHDNPVFRKINLTVSNQFSDEIRKIQKENSSAVQREHDQVKTWGMSAEIHSEINKNWQAVSGAEFYADRVDSEKKETNTSTGEEASLRGLYPDGSTMTNLAGFSQHTLSYNKFSLNAGGRFNAFRIRSVDEEFGEVNLKPSSLVGNLALQYFTSANQQLILSLHSAFRAPNINDISTFGLFDYGIEIPSTGLSPEKALTLEAGYKRSSGNSSIAFTAFRTRINDQIERVEATYNGSEYLDGQRVYKKENMARSMLHGVEFESTVKLNSCLSLLNNLCWTHGENTEKGEPMRRIPPLNGKLALQYAKSKLFGETEFLFAAKQDRLSNGDIDDHRIPRGGTPGWEVVNLKLGYSLEKVSVNAGLQNMFNTAYRVHGSGVDAYGRSWWMSLQFEI
ncbi:MAG: TonB-dependent receptor [Prolixibacteraceae bacterium]